MMTNVVRCCVVVGLSAGCLSPVMSFGGGKSPRQAQHETMSDLTPVQLDTQSRWSGPTTTRKIRVWADEAYRAQNVKWQRSFEEPLELANLVLGSLFGLHLAPEFRAWERHVPGSTIDADLEALAERDPGSDVLLVVGLTSSLPLVSATFDNLGYAAVGGRHLIVRGYADLEERKLYEVAFSDLLPEERELSLAARRHHKTAVVLLHEIGHNLGAGHDDQQDTIMNGSYSPRAGSFSPQARELMLHEIDRRLGRGASPGELLGTTAARKPQPEPRSQPPASGRSGPLVFYITPSGAIELDGKVIDGIDVDNLLEDAFARDRSTEVIIRRSRSAPAGALEPIVERATAIGLKVSIAIY